MGISCDPFPVGGAERASCGWGDEVRVAPLEIGRSLSLRILRPKNKPKLLRPGVRASLCCSSDDRVGLRPLPHTLLFLWGGEPGGPELEFPESADALEFERRTGTAGPVGLGGDASSMGEAAAAGLSWWGLVGLAGCDRTDISEWRRPLGAGPWSECDVLTSAGRLGRGNRGASFLLRNRKTVVVVVVCVVVVVWQAIVWSPELAVERDDSESLGPGRCSDEPWCSS